MHFFTTQQAAGFLAVVALLFSGLASAEAEDDKTGLCSNTNCRTTISRKCATYRDCFFGYSVSEYPLLSGGYSVQLLAGFV